LCQVAEKNTINLIMQSFVCDNFFRDALTPPKFSSMGVGSYLLTLVMDSQCSKDQGIKLEYSQYWGNSGILHCMHSIANSSL